MEANILLTAKVRIGFTNLPLYRMENRTIWCFFKFVKALLTFAWNVRMVWFRMSLGVLYTQAGGRSMPSGNTRGFFVLLVT
jgi:hypothetical protein